MKSHEGETPMTATELLVEKAKLYDIYRGGAYDLLREAVARVRELDRANTILMGEMQKADGEVIERDQRIAELEAELSTVRAGLSNDIAILTHCCEGLEADKARLDFLEADPDRYGLHSLTRAEIDKDMRESGY